MRINWELVREISWWVYRKAAQLYLFLSICLWALGCVVAHRPVGVSGYVQFVGHVFQWQQPVVVRASYGRQPEH
jgi:hypothetical protein